ncbi:hypothetical protein Q1695_014214 [Nippostrongylus brasiliensis]|nr:hypothetical protein Q1695_014214 [Nippostrongylus brasiliensis]
MSMVWDMFVKKVDATGSSVGECKLCKKLIKIPQSKTTTNLLGHLKNNHAGESLNGSYVPPTSRTLLKIMDDYVNEIDGHNRKLLAENAARVVITADCWTSFDANTGLLAISGHIVSPDFGKRENFILDCVPLGQESHTAGLIADKIRESLGRVNLKDNDVFTVCTAHIINLAVRSALQCPQVAFIIQKCKGIISKLNRSATLKGSLSRCLKAEGLNPMALASDCPTRWNSTYMMIGDILTYSALERLIEEQGFDHFEQHEVRECKYWTRWEMKRYSAKERTEESSSDDDD